MLVTHTPTILDAGSDLLRAVYSSFIEGLDGTNVRIFVQHAKDILSMYEESVSPTVMRCIEKFDDTTLTDVQRQEYLLTASLVCR